MRKYEKPSYETEMLEANDIIMASIEDAGEATLGNITGEKAIFKPTNDIF